MTDLAGRTGSSGPRQTNRRHVALAVVALAGLLQASAGAHPLQFSYVDLNLTRDRVDAAITVHAFDAAHELGLASEADVFAEAFVATKGWALSTLLLSRMEILADGEVLTASPVDVIVVPDQSAVVVRVEYPPVAPGARLELTARLFPYDPIHQTFVKVHERGEITFQEILTVERPSAAYAGAAQGRGDVFRRFVASGIEHISIGPDHVLFLVGLLLAGGGFWQLVRIVTVFTLAHSVTLSVAALDVVTLPDRLIEPAIALSICYVGVDNLIRRPGGHDRRTWIAFGFGLVHGFGFASVLREIGLPRALLGWSLFAFNVGVEIGQLIIVAGVAVLLAALARRWPPVRRRVVTAGSVVVIWAGFYWLVERLFLA